MEPEDILIEAIQAASIYGDSERLRREQCAKLRKSIERSRTVREVETNEDDEEDDQA